MSEKDKNIILFINHVSQDNLANVKLYSKKIKKKLRIAVIRDSKKRIKRIKKGVDIFLSCDLSQPLKVAKALLPHQENLLAVTCRGEAHITFLTKVIPHVPYLRTPTKESLEWATDKIMMRERFRVFDKKITPKFKVISNCTKKTIDGLIKEVGFPLVVKPAELASSLLVNICYHKEELEKTLKKSFRGIKRIYKENKRLSDPKILAEEFMEGEMYSIDAYVSSRGRIWFCPIVHVKTGKQIGFDDFFGYQRITPTALSKTSVKEVEKTTEIAIKALALRSTTIHAELLKTEKGWKIIEVGPRIGGFRNTMYALSYGINHALNDVLIRIPKKPEIPRRVKGYTAVLKLYSKKEGKIKKIKGLKKIKDIKSLNNFKQNKKIGDRCKFAKNGGKSVFDVILFNKDRSKLLADIRRMEDLINIEI